MANIMHLWYHVSTFLFEYANFSKQISFFLPLVCINVLFMFVDLVEFQTFLPFSPLPLQHHLDIFHHYYFFFFILGWFSYHQLWNNILLDKWRKKPNNNRQTSKLLKRNFIKEFTIYKKIYKNDVQCKVRM